MKCHYELPISSNTHLVGQSQSSVNLYYLEQIFRHDNIPQEVIMNLITESQPAERLKKLIRIGRLDEAEVWCDDVAPDFYLWKNRKLIYSAQLFAKQFNLSQQPIHEARVRRLLIEIGSISKVSGEAHPPLLASPPQFEISFQEKLQLIEEKQAMLLDLVTKMVQDSNNAEFLISLRNTEVTDKEIIQKLLVNLLENVDFKNNEAKVGDIKEAAVGLLRTDRSIGHRIQLAIFCPSSKHVQAHHEING